MQEASARSKQTEVSQQLITDQISMEIRQKYLNYQQSLEKIKIYERSVDQAKENFQINENKYKQGLALLSDYQDADVLLLQAQINYSTGKADSMIAYYELQESTGNLQ
jgi:outer membrane protein TolC